MMDAVLVIDKPVGMTSHDVVARVRCLLGERSIGHLGTLDPSATGVLPLVTGRFTRLAQFYAAADKTYEGVIRLGFSTDTYDAEGEPVGAPKPVQVSLEQLRQCARVFTGNIQQLPPRFSAKKIAGVPAYKLARKKQEVNLKPGQVKVHSFVIHELKEDRVRFSAQVSAGTYVRSLAHDLGQKLGLGAHLAELRRIASGEFTAEQAVTLEQLAELTDQASSGGRSLDEALAEISFHPRMILPQFPSVTVTQEVAGWIRNGRTVNLPDFSPARQVKVFVGERQLLAIASRIAGTLFQPRVVLHIA